jgi:hypothetical protein
VPDPEDPDLTYDIPTHSFVLAGTSMNINGMASISESLVLFAGWLMRSGTSMNNDIASSIEIHSYDNSCLTPVALLG